MTAVHDSSVGPWPFENLVDRYELAYRASEDALCDQRDRIDEMRGRAITLLSVAVGVLAFLGERLFDNGASSRLDTGGHRTQGRHGCPSPVTEKATRSRASEYTLIDLRRRRWSR